MIQSTEIHYLLGLIFFNNSIETKKLPYLEIEVKIREQRVLKKPKLSWFIKRSMFVVSLKESIILFQVLSSHYDVNQTVLF